MRYKIILSYDGSAFNGWQVQPDAPTVQGALETALGTLLREKIAVTGAGRTDTGVNASYYVAHFDGPEADAADLCYKLNAILPPQISVSSVEPAAADFHARFDAKQREYTYYLHRSKDPFLASRSYLCCYPVLDFDAMNRAAEHILGTHDFSCFEKTGGDNKTSICTVTAAKWERYEPEIATGTECWRFTVSADRFLRNMVRAIVGTLLEVGRGRRTPESVAGLVADGDRCAAGESVPGHALFLSGIRYE